MTVIESLQMIVLIIIMYYIALISSLSLFLPDVTGSG